MSPFDMLFGLLHYYQDKVTEPLAANAYGPLSRNEVGPNSPAMQAVNSQYIPGLTDAVRASNWAVNQLPTTFLADAAMGQAKSLGDIIGKAPQVGLHQAWRDVTGPNLQAYQGASPLQKLALETEFDPSTYATGAIGKGLSLGLKGLQMGGKAAFELPFLSQLLDLHPSAMVNQFGDAATTLANRAYAAGISPKVFTNTLAKYYTGQISPEIAKAALQVGSPSLTTASDIHGLVGKQLPALVKSAASPQEFYGQLPGIVRTAANQAAGIKPPGRIGQGWQDLNSLVRQIDLSGGTSWVANMVDILGKTKMAGLNPMDVVKDFIPAMKGQTLPEVTQLMGGAGLPAEAGTNVSQMLLGVPNQLGTLQKTGSGKLAGIGAVLGGLSDPLNPLSYVAGAASLPMAKLGLAANTTAMKAGEVAARSRFFVEGARKYLSNGDVSDFFNPALRDQAIKNIKGIVGYPKFLNIAQQMEQAGHLATPAEFQQMALRAGVNPTDVGRAVSQFADLHDEAIQAGSAFAQKYHFPYNQDTNLIHYLRQVTPFPVWPAKNLPFYLEKGIENPNVTGALAQYERKTADLDYEQGLPGQYLGKVPVPLPGGNTVWVNPLAPLSITSQMKIPNVSEQSAGGGLQSLADLFGFGFTPLVQYPAQAAGIINQGRDFAPLNPWAAITGAGAQTLTGRITDPEYAIKGPMNTIREAVAPDAAGDASYQQFLVKKRLAEMSLEQTGKPWQDVPAFQRAMIDPYSPLYVEAARSSGMQTLGENAARRVLPLNPSFLTAEEAKIRQQAAALRPMERQGILSPAQMHQLYPGPYTYDTLHAPPLETKLRYYESLPSAQAQEAFMAWNPDLRQYLGMMQQQSRGLSRYTSPMQRQQATVQQYLQSVQQGRLPNPYQVAAQQGDPSLNPGGIAPLGTP